MRREPPAPGRLSRIALANWPVSIRLTALLVMASLTGLVFGGLRVADAVAQASAYGRTTQLAVLGGQVTAFAQAIEDERDLTAGVTALTALKKAAVAAGAAPREVAQRSQALTQEQASLRTAQRITSDAAESAANRAADVGPGFGPSIQAKASALIAQAKNLTALRAEVAGQPPSVVIADYSDALASLFAFNDEISSTSGDAQLADGARALGALSRAKDQASQQRAILYVAFIESGPAGTGGSAALQSAGGLQALIIARSLQLTDGLTFQSAATAAQQSAYLAAESGQRVATALQIGSMVAATGSPQAVDGSVPGLTRATAPAVWYRDMSTVIGGMRAIEYRMASALVARSELLQRQAAGSALITAVVTVVAVLFMVFATALVGRSLLRPLRRLQADALEIAAVRLPARVAAAARGTDLAEGAATGVEPVGVRSTDEIGKVARAFDQVHAEAVRLASTEAKLRGNLNAMFISLSRRSVPLVERLARMIDSLEQHEDDHERLADLFAMDHLVTRMRRNSENLLVLGGEEPVRKWSGPVPLSDVTHAAAAEIEQYSRVTLTVQPGVAISGQAAADVVHLLAELIENATLFSPRDTQVRVTAREIGRGDLAIEIHDDGVGVSASRLADMNWRLDHPPVIDVSVSRHMGLFAVSRLAARHGIRVRLRAGTPQGLSALIWVPASITGPGSAPPAGTHSRRAVDAAGAFAPARHSAGKHRVGLLGSTADQPVLTDRGAGDDSPAGPERPARTTTLAWFAAKAPSSQPAPSPGPGRPGAGDTPAAGYADWAPPLAGTRSASAGPQAAGSAQDGQTTAGLPRRVPRAAMRDAAPVLSAPVPSPPAGSPPGAGGAGGDPSVLPRRPRPGSPAGPRAGFPRESAPRAAAPQVPTPRRRSPEAARSRLAGFQLGSHEAEQTGPTGPTAEAEHEQD